MNVKLTHATHTAFGTTLEGYHGHKRFHFILETDIAQIQIQHTIQKNYSSYFVKKTDEHVMMLYRTKIHTIIGRLVAIVLYTITFCLGDLCDDNSDICESVIGCYSDKNAWYDSCNMNWWAYVPRGKFACPEGGCPLYIWMHGTKDVREQESFIMLFEMMKRGFIAVQAGYDAGSTIEYINLGT